MEEIKSYISKIARELSEKKSSSSSRHRRNTIAATSEKSINKLNKEAELKRYYHNWLTDLNKLMHNCQYRHVLQEIESKKNEYKALKNDLWKCRVLEAKAMLKIIKIKFKKYSKEIGQENSKQNCSVKYWFNNICMTLEELVLEYNFSFNKHLNYKDILILKPIENIFELYVTFIYYLILFSLKIKEIPGTLSYFAIVEKLMPYIPFISDFKSLNMIQKIYLIKIKIYIQNYDFINAYEDIIYHYSICFRGIFLVFDLNSGLSTKSIKNYEKTKKRYLYKILLNIIISFYLRGIICEHLGLYLKAIGSYRQCKWFAKKFLDDFSIKVYQFFSNLENKIHIYLEIFKDIRYLHQLKQQDFVNDEIKNKKKQNKIKSLRPYQIHSAKKFRVGNMTDKELENYLNIIGQKLLKDELNRNNNYLKKYTKISYILSTVNMIDNLLSKDFTEVLKKMDHIEVTKPEENINHLINKKLAIQRQKYFKKIGDEEIARKNKIKLIHYKANSCSSSSNFSFSKNINYPIRYYNTKSRHISSTSLYAATKNTDRLSSVNSCGNFKSIALYNNSNKKNSSNSVRIPKSSMTFLNMKKSCSTTNMTSDSMVKKHKIFKYHNNSCNTKYELNRSPSKFFKCNYKRVIKIPLNKNVFLSSFIGKKNYLDSFYEKEMTFQKNLLNAKKCEIGKKPEDFDMQKMKKFAENEFNIKYSSVFAKAQKENIISVFSKNEFNSIDQILYSDYANIKNNKRHGISNLENIINVRRHEPYTDKDLKNVPINNEEKSKILTYELEKIERRQADIQNKKRNMIVNSVKKKGKFYD